MQTIIFLIAFVFSLSSFSKESIGIIGAGPSGLVAASELLAKGYDQVTILEKEDHIGGKVKTVMYQGLPYEMGAVITAPDYSLVLEIARELNISLTPTPISSSYRGSEQVSMMKWSDDKYGYYRYAKLPMEFTRFSYFVLSHKDFFAPGLTHTPKSMHNNFEDFMHEHHMHSVLETFRPVMVGCGYGYAESMPAPYWMKLMKTFGHEYPKHAMGFRPFYQGFTDGWQNLWEKYALSKNLEINTNSEVLSVKRSNNGVTVETSDRTWRFDRLIITIPHLAHHFMELSDEEKEIFGYTKTIPYKTTLAEITNLPRQTHMWLRDNSTKYDAEGNSNDGKPVLISSNQDSMVYQIYQFTEEDKNDATLRRMMKNAVSELGGELKKIIAEDTFAYFPHFTVEGLKANAHINLEGRQGMDGIYFTGALLNMETVEFAAQHAKTMIKKHF